MVCNSKGRGVAARLFLAAALLTSWTAALAQNSPPATLWFQDPVTEVAHRQIDLHNYILLVCVVRTMLHPMRHPMKNRKLIWTWPRKLRGFAFLKGKSLTKKR